MGGHIRKASVRHNAWIFPVEIVFEAIVLGVGVFEGAIFVLGTLRGTVPTSVAIIGAIYFALPYNLLQVGLAIPNRFLSLNTLQKFGGILLLNVPFLLFLLAHGSASSNSVLLGLVVLGLLFTSPKIQLHRVPVLDLLSMMLYVSGPFLYAVLLAGNTGLWWLPAWICAMLVIGANYLMYKLPTIGLEMQMHSDGTAIRLGVDRTLAVVFGMYIVATILPILGYGWHGVPASILLMWYVVVALSAIPFRIIGSAMGLYRVWRGIWFLNYPVAGLIMIYAWFLIVR